MRQLPKTIVSSWRVILASIVGVGAVISLLLYRLSTLVVGTSSTEKIAHQPILTKTAGLLDIFITDPLYLPYRLGQYILMVTNLDGVFALRALSCLFAFIFTLGFFGLARRWLNLRQAILGTALMVSSAWFLHAARVGSPLILYAALPLLLYCLQVLKDSIGSKMNKYWYVASIVLLLMAIYTPGFVWLVAVMIVWQHKTLQVGFAAMKPIWKAAIGFLVIAGLLPLAISSAKDLGILRAVIGIPDSLQVATVFSNFWHIPVRIFWRMPAQPSMWLGTLPLLDIFAMAMVVFGMFWFAQHIHTARSRLILALILVGWILASLGLVSMTVLLPLVYLLVVVGAAFLLQEWYRVFPKNPVARGLGMSLIALAVVGAVYYNLNHYFIAWPRSPETKAVYTVQKPAR